MYMKNALGLVCLFAILTSFIDSGGGYDKLFVRVYESQTNFYYRSVEDSIRYVDEKGRPRFMKCPTNIALYDITQDKISYLFEDSLNENIVGFAFEMNFNSVEKSITMYEENSYELNWRVENSYLLKERPPSDKLLIVTYSPQTKLYSFWTADKKGGNLKRQSTFIEADDIDIDVRNSCVLVFSSKDGKLVVNNFKY